MSLQKLTPVFLTYCLLCLLIEVNGSFIKPNNVPRVGRSNEAEMSSDDDQGLMGYVIKTNKNIPRMGRRNYDSENRFDIPKFYQLPHEMYEGNKQILTPEEMENYYQTLQN